jgi:hypothetical protein
MARNGQRPLIAREDSNMKQIKKILFVLLLGGLAGCASTKGAVVGAGIGALAGDACKGAAIGASVGTVVDIID